MRGSQNAKIMSMFNTCSMLVIFAAKTLHGCVTGLPYSRKYILNFSWHGKSVALWNSVCVFKKDNFYFLIHQYV